MDIFRYLDIVIAFSCVMLIASSVVTAVTQWILNIRNYRAVVLQAGLEKLIQKAAPAINPDEAREIAKKVTLHELVVDGDRPGSVVHREELVRILLELAGSNQLTAPAKEKLCEALTGDKAGDPAKIVARIDAYAARLEADAPGMATYVRRTKAIMAAQPTETVSTVMTWFDSVGDRMSQYFARKARLVTTIAAAIVAFALPLDSVALLKRLAVDDKLRESLIAEAEKRTQTETDFAKKDQAKDDLAVLRDSPGAVLPPGWWQYKVTENGVFSPQRAIQSFFGAALSAVLLALGGPFWFEALKSLLRLRPSAAAVDEADRTERVKTEPSPPPTIVEAPVTIPVMPVAAVATAPIAALPGDSEIGDDNPDTPAISAALNSVG